MATLMCETCGTRPATHRVIEDVRDATTGTRTSGTVAKCCASCATECANQLCAQHHGLIARGAPVDRYRVRFAPVA
jgi:hypothetical protein